MMIVGSYALIVILWGACQVILIPYVVNLLLLVTAILYAACHASLELREEAPQQGDDGYDPNAAAAAPKETLRTEDAYQFPLVGSMSLVSLYLAVKYLGPELVNMLIGGYFGLVGVGALTMCFAPMFALVMPKSVNEKKLGWKFEIATHPFPDWLIPQPLDLGMEFTATDLVGFAAAAVVIAYYFQERHWTLNNVIGICFCLQGIERFSLGTYKIGAILLVGLFFYDIFWVFGTDVMVTVAKNLDGPIKILFPRSLEPNDDGKLDLSLLGLGDIVIPGFFLSLLLRFDAHMAKMPTQNVDIHAPFPKPYFHSALAAYVLGMCTTLFVMIQFNAAQPALLYLVPACLGSSFLCATMRGEIADLFAYSEEEDEEEEVADADATGKDGAPIQTDAKEGSKKDN
uniref:Signal peptide peptidase n=1 Tax=Craspedostauros australis TaxID=1486917 RepID=A0A7R9WTW8_9STRA